MKIVIAPDSFKDACTAIEAAEAIGRGVRRALPNAEIVLCPLADGGEHTLEVWRHHTGGERHEVEVSGPLGERVKAPVALSADGASALIELASAAGLERIPPHRRNPLHTSTRGVGELIAAAKKLGARRLVLALGGSATHDCGAGMAAALGWRFLDRHGHAFVPVGGSLHRVARIEPPGALPPFEEVIALCDVRNPLVGPQGAARTYAPQKGASPQEVERLEENTRHFGQLLDRLAGRPVAALPGAGAAGGMGAGAMAFLGARLLPGARWMMDVAGFEAALAGARWVFTGEGRFDGQTAHGKLVAEVARRAKARGSIGLVVLCGANEADVQAAIALGINAVFRIAQHPCTLEEALSHTLEWLEHTAWAAARLIQADSSTGSSSK